VKRIIVVIIILAMGFSGYYFLLRKRKNPEVKQTKGEKIAVVKRGSIELKVLATGTIQPYTRIEIHPPMSGRIEKVLVRERDIVKEGDILAWLSSEERISLIDAARSLLQEAQQKRDSAAIEEAKRALKIAENAYRPLAITSTITGEVIKRNCEPGQNVYMTDILFVIADRLVASVQVDEADIGKISIGEEAVITLDAYPQESLKGKLVKISREGRVSAGVVVYDVLVEVPRVPPYWSSGMTANVEFLVQKKDSILVLPKSAIIYRGDRKFVALGSDSTKFVMVETGITDGKLVEILTGLQEGDTVKLGEAVDIPGTSRNAIRGGFIPPIAPRGR